MELKKNLSLRKIFTVLYIVSFLTYVAFSFTFSDGVAYTFDGGLVIPSINLTSGVTKLHLKDHKLNTPDTIVGSYSPHANKTFLIGHSSTVFKNLDQVKVGDEISYNNIKYLISKMEVYEKSDINMNEVLKSEEKDTIIIMTCAGEPMGEKDATHRLIVTAVKN